MERRTPVLPSEKAKRAMRNYPWLQVVVEAIDSRLRRRLGVIEYAQSSDCVFRIQIIRNAHDLFLKDGTCLRPGDRIIDLHFWNQQVPLMSEAGPTLGWARRMVDGFRRSLQELAQHLAATADTGDIAAVRAVAALGAGARSEKIARILSHFGFEIVLKQDPPPSPAQQIHRLGENILISLIVLAYNGIALRPDTLRRGRVHAYLSRRALDERYGAGVCRHGLWQQPKFARLAKSAPDDCQISGDALRQAGMPNSSQARRFESFNT
jgi:hypothetical protein